MFELVRLRLSRYFLSRNGTLCTSPSVAWLEEPHCSVWYLIARAVQPLRHCRWIAGRIDRSFSEGPCTVMACDSTVIRRVCGPSHSQYGLTCNQADEVTRGTASITRIPFSLQTPPPQATAPGINIWSEGGEMSWARLFMPTRPLFRGTVL